MRPNYELSYHKSTSARNAERWNEVSGRKRIKKNIGRCCMPCSTGQNNMEMAAP